MTGKRDKGRQFEKLAEQYLIENGFTILQRNWMAGHKEIDLIAQIGNTIVFVEVKGGMSHKFGHPAEWVDKRKQDNLISAAEQYIISKNLKEIDFRFDLITIFDGKLEHYPDAFQKE